MTSQSFPIEVTSTAGSSVLRLTLTPMSIAVMTGCLR
eukprot:CAMPEP_0116946524 /NCGR_PEP_ID=MMETSP0467-20121206/37049_1 /TAXON_ID=283647 /ORGANISM="Mesodinium pulex, Strain SPMC105" /LENGTH=36 /DNA_ID= /DNA_START= /DNA_END= /DNA_ORIENTATION=